MIDDDLYFDKIKGIPKEEFFVERTKRLSVYFKKLLNTELNAMSMEIHFN